MKLPCSIFSFDVVDGSSAGSAMCQVERQRARCAWDANAALGAHCVTLVANWEEPSGNPELGHETARNVGMHQMRVIGVPRSGTNLTKYLVENYTDIRCYFHLGWWKHSPIPPLMYGMQSELGNEATVVMFREPLNQIVSFFKFAREGRAAIKGANDIHNFISSPITMNPGNPNIKYQYLTPIEYWIQFYYSALYWKNENKLFIELDDIQNNPELIKYALSILFPQENHQFNPVLPYRYFGRNVDKHISESFHFEEDKTFADQKFVTQDIVNSLNINQISEIRNGRTIEIYESLKDNKLRSPL